MAQRISVKQRVRRVTGTIGAITTAALIATPAMASMGDMPMPMPKIPKGQAVPAPMGGTFLDIPVPANILNLKLQAADGHTFTLASLKGKTVLISNFLTSCQEICPMTTANMQKIADKIDASGVAKKVVVVELTVDPERDTPSRLKAYQALFGSSNWLMATGSKTNVAAIWKFFGAPASKMKFSADELKTLPKDWQTGKVNAYDMMHADLVLVLSKDSKWVWLDLGSPKTLDGKIPSALKKFLSEDGLKNLAKPEEPSWGVPAAVAALATISQSMIH
mgnify:CR=1 FL=1